MVRSKGVSRMRLRLIQATGYGARYGLGQGPASVRYPFDFLS